MGAAIEFDESWMQKRKAPRGVLFVVPAKGVLQDEWDAFDGNAVYENTYTTNELVRMKGYGFVTVLNRFSNYPWSATQESKPGKKRTRRSGRGRRNPNRES
jgi:hypothetical protein